MYKKNIAHSIGKMRVLTATERAAVVRALKTPRGEWACINVEGGRLIEVAFLSDAQHTASAGAWLYAPVEVILDAVEGFI